MPRGKPLQPQKSARHLFGWKLRNARLSEEWTLDDLSRRVGVSRSHLSRIETADYMIPLELPPRLDELFGFAGTFQELYAIARLELHPDQYKRRMELEGKAVAIREYSPQVVPGLLQTEDYARALFLLGDPHAAKEDISKLVQGRMLRQRALEVSRTRLSVILDEAVLRRSYGGPAIMRAQFSRLLRTPSSPRFVLQVLPFSHGGHALAGGSLSVLTLPRGEVLAYEEAINKGTLVEDRDEVEYRSRHYDLLAASALSPQDSVDMIRSAMEDLPYEPHP
ncbi:helix-turn-helix transcriptional regulator [Streptomyces albidoflavus]|jgi:transcriptional regulator with XRE-family HTH domain|uniref:Helix-turn-helix transcriptional regulator n=1 Tax=Streptomyces odorifer TaxID=53450 RepID=A0A7Y6F586_9ACTN|nr:MULTISPECIES: helix-turn-helix transcriptional regulator [Streptomyces]NUV34198.1 helix-turn-helix transcriptional regulator [Streptomyces sp. KAI-27]NUV49409.1 helix-turn-helix transcriptional regulator [Streptomyces sp. CAI-78]MBV1952813.1 helix-turn-helix transcriptional regulator [Streptomyces sp. BV333]NUV32081.1 helix-turn-helix transcriptional regulator [Streptomyces odorifer]QDD62306.1 helix-turn-helix transcriptional regulator [Streptomyces albidoflavus]